jgi:hypothetical protein
MQSSHPYLHSTKTRAGVGSSREGLHQSRSRPRSPTRRREKEAAFVTKKINRDFVMSDSSLGSSHVMSAPIASFDEDMRPKDMRRRRAR